jgi:hypothetical protein
MKVLKAFKFLKTSWVPVKIIEFKIDVLCIVFCVLCHVAVLVVDVMYCYYSDVYNLDAFRFYMLWWLVHVDYGHSVELALLSCGG